MLNFYLNKSTQVRKVDQAKNCTVIKLLQNKSIQSCQFLKLPFCRTFCHKIFNLE